MKGFESPPEEGHDWLLLIIEIIFWLAALYWSLK
jgi:hypothetical protein